MTGPDKQQHKHQAAISCKAILGPCSHSEESARGTGHRPLCGVDRVCFYWNDPGSHNRAGVSQVSRTGMTFSPLSFCLFFFYFFGAVMNGNFNGLSLIKNAYSYP